MPLSNSSQLITDQRYSLIDLKRTVDIAEEAASKEEKERKKAESRRAIKELQTGAAREVAKARRSKTIQKILEAINELRARGESITQGRVGDISGKGLRTVKRWWHEESVQAEINGSKPIEEKDISK